MDPLLGSRCPSASTPRAWLLCCGPARRRRRRQRRGPPLARDGLPAPGCPGRSACSRRPTNRRRHCRRQLGRFVLREDFVILIFARKADGARATARRAFGLHRIDWAAAPLRDGLRAPSGVEGLGVVSEAVRALARMAFDRPSAHAGSRSAWTTTTSAAGSSPSAPGSPRGFAARFDAITPVGEPRSTEGLRRVRGPRSRHRSSLAAGEKRSTASVIRPSMPKRHRRCTSAGSFTV